MPIASFTHRCISGVGVVTCDGSEEFTTPAGHLSFGRDENERQEYVGGRGGRKTRTDAEGSVMALTNARLVSLSVRMTSVRPCLNNLVDPVSYVAVMYPWSLYHAS